MNRAAWLAAVAMILVLGATFGQSRSGTAGGGPEGRRRAGGFRTVGAFGGEVQGETQRSAQLEMEGGQKLDGTVKLRPILVDSDLGQYAINPDKIKMIRLLKPVNEDNVKGVVGQRDSRGNLLAPDQTSPTGTVWITRGKVITTSDKEIIGDIHIPTDFKLVLEFGNLTPAPDKLRTITLLEPRAADAPGAGAGAPTEAGRPGRSGGPGGAQRPEVEKP
jgi:hypothetical protein